MVKNYNLAIYQIKEDIEIRNNIKTIIALSKNKAVIRTPRLDVM